MTEASKAIFLSYASEDAAAARRICDALRAAGIEVWFDQSDLRGGDAWDAAIRRQIKVCALFIPLISRNTHAREEGYFRLEWKLAVDRSHLMTRSKAFLLPVVIDDTREDDEHVPESFRDVQWSRLPGGNTSQEFVEHVSRLLSPQWDVARAPTASSSVARSQTAVTSTSRRPTRTLGVTVAVLAAVGAALWFYWSSSHREERSASTVQRLATSATTARATAPDTFAPPGHSVAVLPFSNLSGDAKQEYFSDGLTEELINVLSHINELEVSARTSSFSFKGTTADVGAIARKLNVAAILEGSIRRSGNKVRITAQLIDTRNGFHMWSQTYDRDLTDILALQTEIATAVAQQLQVTLFGGEATQIVVGGTHNPRAYDAYLRGTQLLAGVAYGNTLKNAKENFDEAIALDPDYAAAHAARARVLTRIILDSSDARGWPALRDQARKSAARAVALAPDLAAAHVTLADIYISESDFQKAAPEIERALALAPGSASVQATFSGFASLLGHHDVAVTAAQHAARLDPQNFGARSNLLRLLYTARRFDEALVAAQDVRAINRTDSDTEVIAAFAHIALGQLPEALRICESAATPLSQDSRNYCLAVAYHAQGRLKEAEAALEKLKATNGDAAALAYAEIYAQWGEAPVALQWLATAERLHSPALQSLRVEWLLDPIRDDPQFKAVEQRLNFPP